MLKTIAVASSYRMTKDQNPSFERRYFISSAEFDVDQLANACRSHCLIENQLHWVLDGVPHAHRIAA
jgi:predicted transposase YbfD/YdcC